MLSIKWCKKKKAKRALSVNSYLYCIAGHSHRTFILFPLTTLYFVPPNRGLELPPIGTLGIPPRLSQKLGKVVMYYMLLSNMTHTLSLQTPSEILKH